MNIQELSQDKLIYMQDIRRKLHENPELSHYEYETQKLICGELEKMGIPFTRLAGTGVCALIEGEAGEKAGRKTILLRADMDALPIQETVDVEFASKVPNVMHACGHDGHVAGLLGAASVLNDIRSHLGGNVKLMFQPSEEYDSGAKEMVEAGILNNPDVDAAISCHLWGTVEKGFVGIKSGEFMAAPDAFKVTLTGKGGHGSKPDQCDDLILMASRAITGTYENMARKISPFDHIVLSVCAIHAGEGYNVLPDEVEFVGTIRHYDEDLRNKVLNILDTELRRATFGTDTKYNIELDTEVPAVVNSPDITELVRASAQKAVGADNVLELDVPDLGGDDFSFVTREVPSCYFYVGIAEDSSKPVVHHSGSFSWDDDVLTVPCSVLAQAAFDYLK